MDKAIMTLRNDLWAVYTGLIKKIARGQGLTPKETSNLEDKIQDVYYQAHDILHYTKEIDKNLQARKGE